MTPRPEKNNKEKQARIQDIVFGTNGLKLHGKVMFPVEASADSPVPGVLLCHGFGASHKAMLPSAEILARNGIASMVFDFRGHCDSEGVVDGKLADDIIDAWNVFKDYPEIDKNKMGLVGHSLGAMSAIVAAEYLDSPRVLVALSCPPSIDKTMMDNNLTSNFGHWGNERSRIIEYPRQGAFPWMKGIAALGCRAWMYFFGYTVRVDIPKFFKKVLEMNMLESISRLKDCSKLFVFCEGDSITPYAQSIAVYEAAEDPKMLMLSKGGFHTTPLMRGNVRDQWTNWIAEELTR
jgi:pimeloyl-ACP methyl ester carboxylesterase